MENPHGETVKGILNETTMTVHKHETGTTAHQTVCGHTHHVAPDRLRILKIERATEQLDASKCGQCFDDGGGY